MTRTPDRSPSVAIAAMLALSATPLVAQTATESFDLDRAWISEVGMVEPFVVDQVKPLGAALDADEIEKSTWVLVVDHPAGRLALVTDQLAYHHVAQGSIRGEPWMVSF